MSLDGNAAKQTVTIRDVAERAQVSISTVSHAFSGSRPISRTTTERVLRAAAELGYDPNPSARSLRTGRSGLVGLVLRPRFAVAVTPDRAETFNRLVGSIATEMLRRKTGLIHVPDIHDPSVASVPMDGCIVAHPYGADDVLGEILRRDIPVVTVDEDPERPDFTWTVGLDYATAVSALLDHLGEQHVASIMLFSGSEGNAWNRRCRETYLAWCERHRVQGHTDELSEGLTTEAAAEVIQRLLDSPGRPDAVIVATSDFAALVAEVASGRGIRVPEDLMVAALTDSEHSRTANPPITAMDLNHEGLAEGAVELMLDRLGGTEKPLERLTVDPVLRLRRSTRRDL